MLEILRIQALLKVAQAQGNNILNWMWPPTNWLDSEAISAFTRGLHHRQELCSKIYRKRSQTIGELPKVANSYVDSKEADRPEGSRVAQPHRRRPKNSIDNVGQPHAKQNFNAAYEEELLDGPCLIHKNSKHTTRQCHGMANAFRDEEQKWRTHKCNTTGVLNTKTCHVIICIAHHSCVSENFGMHPLKQVYF